MSYNSTIIAAAAGGAGGGGPGSLFYVNLSGSSGIWGDAEKCTNVAVDSNYNVYSLWDITSSSSGANGLAAHDSDGNLLWDVGHSYGTSSSESAHGLVIDSQDRLHVLTKDTTSGFHLACIDTSDGSTNYSRGIRHPSYSSPGFRNIVTHEARFLGIDDQDDLWVIGGLVHTNKVAIMQFTPGNSSYTEGEAREIQSQGSSSAYARGLCIGGAQQNNNQGCYWVGASKGRTIAGYLNGAGEHFNKSKWLSDESMRPLMCGQNQTQALHILTSDSSLKFGVYGSNFTTNNFFKSYTKNSSYVNRFGQISGGAAADRSPSGSATDEHYFHSFTTENTSGHWMTTVVHYNNSGTHQWTRNFRIQNSDTRAGMIQVDPKADGHIYICMQQGYIKYPRDGSVTGTFTINNSGGTFSIDSNASVSISGSGTYNFNSASYSNGDTFNPATHGTSADMSAISGNPNVVKEYDS